jgi:hypothetical protein
MESYGSYDYSLSPRLLSAWKVLKQREKLRALERLQKEQPHKNWFLNKDGIFQSGDHPLEDDYWQLRKVKGKGMVYCKVVKV